MPAILDFFIHLDAHLLSVIEQYGTWTYALLFFIVFCETGLVVTPFLPGDSLLFAAGTFAGAGSLHFGFILFLLWIAGIIGDTVNYFIGRFFGSQLVRIDGRLIKPQHLEKTRAFYAKHGGKTIILARFIPIVRTFAPFVAGIGKMDYRVFSAYNVVGATLWAGLFVGGGYLFGNIPIVRDNFSAVILAIIVISVLPGVMEYAKHRRNANVKSQ
jgi:membrane-associated protein